MRIKFPFSGNYNVNLAQFLNGTFYKKIQNETVARTNSVKKYFNKLIGHFYAEDAIMLDTSGSILNWNRTFERLYGYTEPEIVGQSVSIFYMPQDRQLHLPDELIKTAFARGTAIHRGKMTRKDGTTFYGVITLKSVKDLNNHTIGFTEHLKEIKPVEAD
jgi:PAS domain S-box-containing protein